MMTELKKVTPVAARTVAATRVPMGVRRQKLASVTIDGFETRWFNDDPPGRISDAQRGGWEFVLDSEALGLVTGIDLPTAELSERVARVVGTNKQGSPITAYLMKIKREWYDADQAAKLEVVAELDRQISDGRIGEQAGDARYKSAISVRHK